MSIPLRLIPVTTTTTKARRPSLAFDSARIQFFTRLNVEYTQTSGYRSAVTDSALLRAPALFALTSSIITYRINDHFNPPRLRSTLQLLSMNNPRCRAYDLFVTWLPTHPRWRRSQSVQQWETTEPARMRCRGGGTRATLSLLRTYNCQHGWSI